MHEPHQLASELWGCGDTDRLFTHGAERVVCPWPRAGRSKTDEPLAKLAVGGLVELPVWLSDIDPRLLWSSQPYVLRQHVTYYRTGIWERTGITSADGHQEWNRFPLVAIDRLGRHVIVAGHHRSAAALLEGRPVRCRMWPVQPDAAEAITPRVLVGTTSRLANVQAATVEQVVRAVGEGHTVVCGDLTVALAAHEMLRRD